MKKNIVIIAYFICTFILNAQQFSEAPVKYDKNGNLHTDMIYIKFKEHNMINTRRDEDFVNGDNLSEKNYSLKKILIEFSNKNGFKLNDIKFRKAIPSALKSDNPQIRKNNEELTKIFIVIFPQLINVEIIIPYIMELSEVEYCHGPVQIVDCADPPNDNYFINGGQWYLNSINAPKAWDLATGNPDIKIALIEKEGVELTHSDLQNKIIGGDNNPAGVIWKHGTHVAGIAGAVTNNLLGVASLGWNTRLLTYQPNNDDIYRTVTAQKITDAVNAGAKIINLSFKTTKEGLESCSGVPAPVTRLKKYYYYNWDYTAIRNAINTAINNGVTIIAAAGNQNGVIGDTEPCEQIPYPCYPAQYPGVIAVSGSQQDNNFVTAWNYGSFISVNAPGRTNSTTGLWTTTIGNSYTNSLEVAGTSFAAPQVSALAALMLSINNSLTPAQVKEIIERTASKVGQYPYPNVTYPENKNNYFGYGRIDAYKALKYTIENYGGVLKGDVKIKENFTIAAGKTLTIEPGTNIKFAPNTGIYINGTLNINGTSVNRVTIERDGTSGEWNGIVFNNGSTGNINYAIIKNANKGVHTSSSNVLVQNTIFDGNFNAISCISSSPKISKCEIKNSTERPIIANYYSNPYLSAGSGQRGNNKIYDNASGAFWAYNSSYIFASSGDLNSYAYNSIINNYNYAAYAGSGCTVYAEANWWGSYPPQAGWFSGNVYYTNALNYNPNPQALLSDANNNLMSASEDGQLRKSINDRYIKAVELKDKGDYTGALNLFLKLLDEINDEEYEIHILVELNELTKTGRKESIKTLTTGTKSLNKHQILLNILEANNKIGEENYSEGVRIYSEILNNKTLKKETELYVLYQLASVYGMQINDKAEAGKYLEILNRKYPGEYLTGIISRYLNSTSEKSSKNLNKKFEETETMLNSPNKYEISQNYPNPFNPSTIIKYQLPEAGLVKIVVYDILGKEVKELVNEYKEAGYYTTNFNGSGLASGIYFYKMTCGSYSATKKMQIIK